MLAEGNKNYSCIFQRRFWLSAPKVQVTTQEFLLRTSVCKHMSCGLILTYLSDHQLCQCHQMQYNLGQCVKPSWFSLLISLVCFRTSMEGSKVVHILVISHLCVRLMKKVGLLQCFQSYNSSEKTNCILNLRMNSGNLKSILSSFISADIGVWHQVIKSSKLQK